MTSSWSPLHPPYPNRNPRESLSKKKSQTTLTSFSKTPKTPGKISFPSANISNSFRNHPWMNQDPHPNLPKLTRPLNPPKLTKPLKHHQGQDTDEIVLIPFAMVPTVSIQSSPTPFFQNPTVALTLMKPIAHPKTITWISALHKVVCLVAFNKVVCLVVIIMFYFMVLSWLALRFGFCQL